MSRPKISVVVPTRLGAATLGQCLRSVLAQDHDNFEIIVSNNGADQATRDVVGALDDARIRLIEPPSLLSMSHNFEYGLSHATGDWLTLIGNDDAILSHGLRRGLDILQHSGAEALASRNCHFQWPRAGVVYNQICLTVPMGRGWAWRSSEQAIRRMLNREIGFNDAPTTYTGGMISAALFDRIKQVDGQFFHSQIPDCYSAFAICSMTERYILCDEPLMVAGTSASSHGLMSLATVPSAFDQYDNIPFHPALPSPKNGSLTSSFQAMLYESYLQSAYLRNQPPITDLRMQLVAIIAYARWFRDHWGFPDASVAIAQDSVRQAAIQNDFDYLAIERDAASLPVKARLSQLHQKFQDFLVRYAIAADDSAPINDVFEACRRAGSLLSTRPSRLKSYVRTAQRRLGRQFA